VSSQNTWVAFRSYSLQFTSQYPGSYPLGTRSSFPGGKAVGAWSWPLNSIWCRGQEYVELYLHSPSTFSWHDA